MKKRFKFLLLMLVLCVSHGNAQNDPWKPYDPTIYDASQLANNKHKPTPTPTPTTLPIPEPATYIQVGVMCSVGYLVYLRQRRKEKLV